MIDLAIKFAACCAMAAALTHRAGPSRAVAAHRLWLLALASPFLVLAGSAFVAPVAVVQPSVAFEAAITSLGPGRLRPWLLAGYAGVSAGLLARVAWGVWSVYALIARSRRLSDDERQRVAAILGGVELEIRESPLDLPLTAGFVTPVVLLPRGWQALSDAALNTILRHEAAHVARRDCAVALAAAIVEAILWVHPGAWLAARRLRWFAEMACDAEAARTVGDEAYASELLALASGWSSSRRPLYTVTAGAGHGVRRRLELLIDEIGDEIGRTRRSGLLTAALVAMILGLLGSASITFAGSRGAVESAPFGGGLHSHLHGH